MPTPISTAATTTTATTTASTADINPATTPAAPNVARMVEDIVGCKWSLAVLGAVRGDVRRPGALEHAIEGLSKKVLSERLSKLVRFGILEKQAFAELPPRVEYRFTPFGDKFLRVLDSIEALQHEVDR